MSEQTANLCTTDACESLRQRLAKYEDAEGRPVSALAEQAREVERLHSDYNEACEDAMCVARELERQKMNCLNLLQQLEDLKAQPSGVVHHNLIEALKFYANGDHLLLADPDAWDTCSGEPMNFLHDDAGTASVEDGSIAKAALDSLNSSPVSAGDDAHYPPCDYCAEPLSYHPWHGSGLINGVESRHIHACDKCRHLLPTVSAGGVDDRAAFEAWMREEYAADEDMLKKSHEGRYFYAKPANMWSAWQARAALSAPSHGEQMRDNRAEFKREERYMVVKLSKLADDLGGDELSREEQIYRLAHFGKALVECVVVESDWPEYEPTWAAIKARVTGSIASNQLPGGWAAKPTDDGEGFIISSPRVNGVASHFSVFPDSKDYASCALWKMLAAAPSAGSQEQGE